MSAPGSGEPHDSGGSWATEGLPLSVRKELLERELRKLGLRKNGGAGANTQGNSGSGPPQDSGGSHPNAGRDGSDHGS